MAVKASRQSVEVLVPIAAVLGLTWILGMITSNTIGGLIHVLLVVAVITVSIRVIQGRRVI